jgi:hypothetical protein
MIRKQKVLDKAKELGYTISEDWCDIRLEAPMGCNFDGNYHELVSTYGHMSDYTKAQAWKDVWEHIGTAEPCKIEDCDWCQER